MRRILAVAAAVAVAAGVLVVGTITATAASCTGTVQIDSFAFNPPVVSPGQSSTLTLVAENCTGQQIQTTDIWSGRYVGADGTTIPPGCPVIDPIAPALTLPANGQATASVGYSTFAMCAAVALKATVNISSGGVTLASQTATLAIGSASTSASPPPGTCAVSYARQSEWSGGFVAQIAIANTGTAPVSGWTLAFAFPGDQVVGNAWNAAVSQSGGNVTATNLSYNRVIAPGASTSFGFQGTWHSTDASPTAFTLNGAACTIR
jgi:hypothetical protein